MRLVNKIFGKANPLNKRKEDINLPLLQQVESSHIILQQYQQLNEVETDIVLVNAVPKGKVPVLEHWYGKLIKKERFEFVVHSSYVWNQ